MTPCEHFPLCGCEHERDMATDTVRVPHCRGAGVAPAASHLPVVLIPQFPTERLGRGEVVRRHLDLSDAERYGALIELLEPSAKPWDPSAIEQMDQALLRSSADDWLLCIGNPSMIAVAAAAFGSIHGGVNVLQFQSRSQRYEALRYTFTDGGTTVECVTTNPEDEENEL